MQISLKDDYDKELGKDLPMLSKTGKITIPMYVVFSSTFQKKKELKK